MGMCGFSLHNPCYYIFKMTWQEVQIKFELIYLFYYSWFLISLSCHASYACNKTDLNLSPSLQSACSLDFQTHDPFKSLAKFGLLFHGQGGIHTAAMFYYVVFLMTRIVFWPIMMKRELSVKEKLWIYWPVHSRVHLWPRTLDSDRRMRLWI